MEEKRGDEIVFCGQKIDSNGYHGTLWPFLKNSMLSHGSRVALINPYTKEEFSFNRVVSLAERLSRGLYKLGLRQGKSLCIFAPNSVENALLCLATLAIGGVVHAPNPASVPGELRRQLELSEAGIVVTVSQLLAPIHEAVAGSTVHVVVIGPCDGSLNYNDLLTLGTEDVTLPTTFGDPGDSVACLLFSSGTTGLPKGVEITQRNIMVVMHVLSLLDENGFITTDDTAVLFLPFFHVFGLVTTLLSCLSFGTRAVIMEKFDMIKYLSFCSRYKATVLYLVPPVVIGLLNHPRLSDYDLSSLRFISCGAAPLGKETEAQCVQKLGVPCLQGYGMTENITATKSSLNRRRSGSCGYPLPNMEFKVVDTVTGKCLGANQTGELYMRGPIRMRGYLKNPEATKDTIDAQGWLKTGDIARFDSDGFMYIVDRQKELIKYKGEQVPPAVLEDVLLSHPAVSDVCVIGRPDPTAGELPMAYIVTAPGHTVTTQQVKDFVAENAPPYMQLRGGVEFKQQILKSPSGKILRRLLRDELNQKLKAKL